MKQLLLLFFLSIGAQGQVIKVVAVKGVVEAESSSGFHAVAEGSPLSDGQVIQTHGDSTVLLAYPNGTRLKLNADTKISLHVQSGIDLLRGAVFAHVNKENHPHFIVKTTSAAAGVRGTDFFTTFDDDKNKDGWLCVKSGEVEVKPVNGSEAVLVKEGFGIVIKPGKNIDPPKQYEWTKHLNWNMDAESGDIVDKTSTKSIYNNLLKHNYD